MVSGNDIKSLIVKLSHRLPEIRVPALKSILSKLNFNLLTIEELCHEKQLLVNLLEWFNFEEATDKDLVFKLLRLLVEKDSGAELLLRIGAVDFFSQLRCNIEDDSFLPEIDFIVHKLLTIHNVVLNDNYQQHNVIIPVFHPAEMNKENDVIDVPIRSVPIIDTKEKQRSQQVAQVDFSCEISFDTKFSTFAFFPWRPLTHSDKAVLESAKLSIAGSDVNLIVYSCRFIKDVLLVDFPAEIFLQHPDIFDTLLGLLKVRQRQTNELYIEPLHVLITLCENLIKRLSVVRDPHFHSPSLMNGTEFSVTSNHNYRVSSSVVEDLSRSISRIQLKNVGRHDASFCSESTIEGPFKGVSEYVDDEECQDLLVEQSKPYQLNLPQFCTSIMNTVQHLFKHTAVEIVLEVSKLSFLVIDLIISSFNLKRLWSENSSIASIFRKEFEVFAHSLTKAIRSHMEAYDAVKRNIGGEEMTTLQMQVLLIDLEVHLLSHFCKNIMIQISNAEFSAHADEIKEVAKQIIYDYSISKFYPTIRNNLTVSCLSVNVQESERLVLDSTVQNSIDSLYNALKLYNCEDISSTDTEAVVKLIRDSHVAIAFSNSSFVLIDRLIEYASDFCDYEDSSFEFIESTFVQFLTSPYDNVRAYCYQSCQKFIEKCLEIEANATNIRNQPSQMLRFLLGEQVLTAIIQSGLLDANESVKSAASWIMYQFLNSRLLFESETWSYFMDNVMHYFIFLQSLTSKDTKIGTTLLQLVGEDRSLTGDSTLLNIPMVDRLRGCLRLMFNTDVKVRIEAVGMLVWYLAKEPQGHRKLPSFSSSTLPKLHNLLFPENQVSVDRHSVECVKTQKSTLDSVWGIAQSKTLDEGVRKSAFDQVAILLQDPSLHAHFLDMKGLDYVFNAFDLALEKDNQQTIIHEYLPSILAILRHLFFWQSKVRHEFSHDSHIFYNLIRSAFILTDNIGAMYDVLFCFTLLLFDEVLMPGGEELFSVPRVIRLHFKFPFSIEARDSTLDSNQCVQHVLPEVEESPLSVRFLNEVLVDNKIKVEGHEIQSAYDEPRDVQLGIARCLNSILTAQSHLAVKESLKHLKIYLMLAKDEPELYVDYLAEIDFSLSLERFVTVAPSTYQDKKLLIEVIDFVEFVLLNGITLSKTLDWINSLCNEKHNLLLISLSTCVDYGSVNSERESQLEDEFMSKLLSMFYAYSIHILVSNNNPSTNQVCANLISSLIDRMKICDSAETYNISSLQKCAKILSLITEVPNWADYMNESCLSKLFPTIISIISFSTGRHSASANLSFMGNAIVQSSLHVLNNLAREMYHTFKNDPIWMEHWKVPSLSQEPNSVTENNFDWLISRMSHRNPQIRLLTYSLMAQFCASKRGQSLMSENCRMFEGGIWQILFTTALDESECCAVKAQCLNCILNLTKDLTIPLQQECSSQHVYNGPVVEDIDTASMVSGLHALEILIEQTQFYSVLVKMLTHYFPFPYVHFMSISALHDKNNQEAATLLEKFNWESSRMTLKQLVFNVGVSEVLATPVYIALLCSCAQNFSLMLPEISSSFFKHANIFQALLKTLDFAILPEIISNYIEMGKEKTLQSDKYRLKIFFHDLCTLIKSVVQFITTLCSSISEKHSFTQLLLNTLAQFLCPAIDTAQDSTTALQLRHQMHESDILSEYLSVISEVCYCLRVLLQTNAKHRLNEILSVLQQGKEQFEFLTILVCEKAQQSSTFNAGDFFGLLTLSVSKGHNCSAIIDLLDNSAQNQEQTSLAYIMCDSLISMFNINLVGSTQFTDKNVESCLRSLLGFSSSAKKCALDKGFVEDLIENLKSLHCQLTTMAITSLNSTLAKEEAFAAKITTCLVMLRNIMFQFEEAKNQVYDHGFTMVVIKLWHWCLTDAAVYHTLLECLQVYTARCHNAAVSMSMNSLTSTSNAAINRHAVSSNTIVHLLIKR